MKKIILKAVTALYLLSGSIQAQQMIVDLTTGDPLLNIGIGGVDPIWQVMKPGSAIYGNAYITTGHDYQKHSPGQTYNTINPFPRTIAPTFVNPAILPWSNFPPNSFTYGDIAMTLGESTYRRQFNFDKNCHTITSANLVIDGVLTGDRITSILLNGYSVNWPYSSMPPNASYIDAMYALSQTSAIPPAIIPQQIIPLNPGDFANGINNFFIKVDSRLLSNPLQHAHSGALYIKAHLEINYTNVGVNNSYFNMSGSNNQICNGQTANLNVGLNVSPIANYWLDVNPGGYSQSASNSQLVQVNPTAPTTYAIKITNQVTGCATQLNWPVAVITPPGPDLMGMGSTEQICFGVTQGFINVSMPGYPNGYPFQLYDVTNNNYYPLGSNNTPYPINPSASTHYQVIFTDLMTGCLSVTDWFVSVNYPDPITGLCNSNLKAVQSHGNIKNTNSIGNLNIAPNPSNGILTVSSSNDMELLKVRIIDVTGKLMFLGELNTNDSKTIDISFLKASLYFIEIENEAGQIVRKKLVKE